jgi:beta-N-acetylhexosaminidase
LDVNNNPANPVINDRSFGEDRELVARKGIAYMRGLQRGGVIATAKHFPGHGDTDTDSHLGLPLIAHSRTRLDSLELYPFGRLVDEGLSAMMVGHLEVPALDSTKGLPSTLSEPIVQWDPGTRTRLQRTCLHGCAQHERAWPMQISQARSNCVRCWRVTM